MSYRIEMQFVPPAWTTVTDVIDDEGIRWFRGIRGNRPEDNVFTPGTMSFSLANDAGNSGELLGYYSPNHTNCRSGFDRGTKVRFVYQLNGVDRVLWTGKLTDIDPVMGSAGIKRTRCRATGLLGDLLEEKIREIGPQLNQTEVQLLTTIFGALPMASQPASTDFDFPVDTYPAALHDLEGGTVALTVAKRVIDSARGILFEKGDGTPKYMNRTSRVLGIHRFVFTDEHLNPETGLSRPTNLDDSVKNRVRMQTHAVSVGPVDTAVLFSHDGPLEIPAGETIEFFLDYQDQANPDFKVGGTDFQDPPDSGTDYEFNAQEDGGGADVTGDVTVTYDFFTSTCKVTIENTGVVTAYKQILQGRGRSIRDLTPVWSESFAARDYGVRTAELDMPYQPDPFVARDEAAFLRASYEDLSEFIDAIEFLANQSDEVLEQAVLREIGDIERVSEEVTGTTLVDGYIQAIEWDVMPGGLINCRFFLAPRIEDEVTSDEDLTVDETFDVDVAAIETRIGFARINLSEVA